MSLSANARTASNLENWKPLRKKKLVGCGGLQCTEAARPSVPIQIASDPAYHSDSTAS
jgi:hypothetical protein